MTEKNPFLYGLLKTLKETYKLTKQRISIGRNKNSQIIINNNTVSKDHAMIEFDEDYNAIIKDLNSTNKILMKSYLDLCSSAINLPNITNWNTESFNIHKVGILI